MQEETDARSYRRHPLPAQVISILAPHEGICDALWKLRRTESRGRQVLHKVRDGFARCSTGLPLNAFLSWVAQEGEDLPTMLTHSIMPQHSTGSLHRAKVGNGEQAEYWLRNNPDTQSTSVIHGPSLLRQVSPSTPRLIFYQAPIVPRRRHLYGSSSSSARSNGR